MWWIWICHWMYCFQTVPIYFSECADTCWYIAALFVGKGRPMFTCLHRLRILYWCIENVHWLSLLEQDYRQWHPVINWFRSFLLRPCESTALQSFQPRHNIQALVFTKQAIFFASVKGIFGKGAPEIKAIGLLHISCKSLLIFVDRQMIFL